jgi:hypothetical protein
MDGLNTMEILDMIDIALRDKRDGRAELSRLALISEPVEGPTSAAPASASAGEFSRALFWVGAGVIALLALWFG